MSAPEPMTLGQRLDGQARTILSLRGEAARRLAKREWPARQWVAPGERRLRVEADVPPVWDDEPHRIGVFDPTSSPAVTPYRFPADLREQLRTVVGSGLDRVVAHDGDVDPAANAVASAHDAAAVTVGHQIFFRQGRFRPRSSTGRGLLAHEAVHAARSTHPGTAWRRATASGREQEEQAARVVGAVVAAEPAITRSRLRRVPTAPQPPDAPASLGHSLRSGMAPTGEQPVVAARRLPVQVAGEAPRPVSRDVAVVNPGGAAGPSAWRLGTPAGGPNGRRRLPLGAGARPGSPAGSGVAAHPGTTVGASPALTRMAGTTVSSAAVTPMAAPADRVTELPPAPPSAGLDPGVRHEAMLRELMRQVRTDRERGA